MTAAERTERSAAIRIRRAEVKRSLKTGAMTLADALDRPEPALSSMMIGELVACPCRWGPFRAERTLRTTRVFYTRTVGSLRTPERAEVLRAVARVEREKQAA